MHKTLLTPFHFRCGATLKNRIVMAPMTTESSFENGMITTDELMYYARRSGNVGMIITSCAHVAENGRFAGSLSAASDNMIPGLKKLADSIKQHGAKAVLQIFHVGRMGSRATLRGEQPVSASAVPAIREDAETPRELSHEEIGEMVEAFAQATRRAIAAGFDGVEIHGANTYLIQQFFSPHSNRRTDIWGGSTEGRMAFPLAIIHEVKKCVERLAVSPFIVGYRLSPEERENPGITLEDTFQLAQRIAEERLDYLHISLNDYARTSIRESGQKTPVLQRIHEKLGDSIPLIGVGSVRLPKEASEMLGLGSSLVAIGRAIVIDPDWMAKAEANDADKIKHSLDLSALDGLALPDKMVEYIQNPEGWFNITGRGKHHGDYEDLTI